jgi:hypothetical protein
MKTQSCSWHDGLIGIGPFGSGILTEEENGMLSSERSLCRDSLKAGATAATGPMSNQSDVVRPSANHMRHVRIGCVGVGGRGARVLEILLGVEGVEIPAICDINIAAAAEAQELMVRSGRAKPELYTRGEDAYRQLMERNDLDAVVIATPWELHALMAVCAMSVGKYAVLEVPCACWMDINCGNRSDYFVSMAMRSLEIRNQLAAFAGKSGFGDESHGESR